MSPHTPGPWAAGGWSSNDTPILTRGTRFGQQHAVRIASVVGVLPDGQSGTMDRRNTAEVVAEAKANAALIAAAPDLLACLKDALSAIEAFPTSGMKVKPTGGIAESIRNAIARAEAVSP